ncbi:MAG: HDIG domain-containing protein [Desulfobacter sp.]|nr:HDIG domain-containing protein [Desulfobacter sp.]WDP84078.1 MAG: HDIG domain-containing protein [Desulfobacter sp.]
MRSISPVRQAAQSIDPLTVIEQFYDKGSPLYQLLVDHSEKVAQKSLEIAHNLAHLDPDLAFIETAAMLHDIGVIKTSAPSIGCTGKSPYICHGYLGRNMLDSLGLPTAFGLVAERHTGAGISKNNILQANLPLPPRDMKPLTLEEKIICCADKFFSKSPKKKKTLMTREKIIDELFKINPGHARRFSSWAERFNL